MLLTPKCLSPRMDRRHLSPKVFLIVLFLVLQPITSFSQKDEGIKVTICHNGKTIEVSEKSLDAHLRHGDYLGTCGSPDDFTGTVETKYPQTGKSESLLSKDLESLQQYFEQNGGAGSDEIFNITDGSKVLIEITAIGGMESALNNFLTSPPLSLTEIIGSAYNPLLFTVLFPIDQLYLLADQTEIINKVEQVNTAILKSGIAESLGDIAQQSDNGRNAFGVSGLNVSVGVLSDSYNTKGKAGDDVMNGDLPGTGNLEGHETNVINLKEYPNTLGSFFTMSDEGRAMLQIVHDVAPAADLYFHTAFVSAEDMALGIKALHNEGCKVIIDDVSHITEPFFIDGMIAQAVKSLPPDVEYVSSAGNFADHSYTSIFAPSKSDPAYHDFNTMGLEDTRQLVTFGQGYYTIVLQWNDDFYSLRTLLNDNNNGARNDLDFILEDENGNVLASAEDNNLGKDPYEILNFSVKNGDLRGNLRIKRSEGTDTNLDVKYIIFRGNNVEIMQYSAGNSTIVGHPNTDKAIAVGALLYKNAPIFDNDLTVASFSSIGGTEVNGIVLQKPDIVGPNGVSTTVNLGGIDFDGDGWNDFFGTSAAAPHVGGAIALLMEAKLRFGVEFNTKELISNTAADMNSPGFDYQSGSGFIQVDEAMMTFAAPSPFVDRLIVPEGTDFDLLNFESFTVTIEGRNFIEDNSYVTIGGIIDDEGNILDEGTLVESSVVNSTVMTATILVDYFDEDSDPPLLVTTNPITSGPDGGSAIAYFSALEKKIVRIKADDIIKLYWEDLLPEDFTASVFVDDVPYDEAGYSLEQLGLSSDGPVYDFRTSATSESNVGKYFIEPYYDGTFSQDRLKKYEYIFERGNIIINKLPVTIQPKELTVTYGDRISLDLDWEFDPGDEVTGIVFDYIFNNSNMTEGRDMSLIMELWAKHIASFYNEDYIALINDESNILSDRGRFLVNTTAWMGSDYYLSNRGRFLVNGNVAMDIDAELIQDYYDSDYEITTLSNVGRFLVNGEIFISNDNVIADAGRFLVNEGGLVNGDDDTDEFKNVVIVFDDDDRTILSVYSVNLVSGFDVTTQEDPQFIVPGALIDLIANNLEITYAVNNLWINPPPPPPLSGDLFLVSTYDGQKLIDLTGNVDDFIASKGEYVEMYNDHIYVLGIQTQRNIEQYDRNGTLISSIPLPTEVLAFTSFCVLPGGKFAVIDNGDDIIYFIDSDGVYESSLDMIIHDGGIGQDIDGVVVDNSLIMVSSGQNLVLKIDLQTHEISMFRDLSYINDYLTAISYYNGVFYLTERTGNVYSFIDGINGETVIGTSPATNVTGITVKEDFAYVTVNFTGEVYKIELATGTATLLSDGFNYPTDIEYFIPVCQPADIWLLSNADPDYSNPPFNDYVINFNFMDDEFIIEKTGFNTSQSISGTRNVIVSEQGNYAWISENVGDNLTKISSAGEVLNYANTSYNYGAAYMVSDERLFALESATIYGGDLYILDSEGNILQTHSYGGIDLAVDEANSKVWIVGADVKILDMDFILDPIVFDPFEWTATSVDFDINGNAWIAEGQYSSSSGTDQILYVSSSGTILNTISTSYDGRPMCIRVNKMDGKVWFVAGNSLHYYIPGEEHYHTAGTGGTSLDIDYQNQIIWTHSENMLHQYAFDGSWLASIDNPNILNQCRMSARSYFGDYNSMMSMQSAMPLNTGSQTKGDITIYPNPVLNILSIDHANSEIRAVDIEVILYNSFGNPVNGFTEQPYDVGEEIGIDLSSLSPQMYYIHISDGVILEMFTIIKE